MKFRSFTDMCLDGPEDYEGDLKMIELEEPCLISSVQVLRQTGWDGKQFGGIKAVVFRHPPSNEELEKTGTMQNTLKWKGAGYTYDFTADPRRLNVFINYLGQFDKAIFKQMQAYLGSNYPKEDSGISPAPAITVK
ncbi:MAG: hypothetical protein K2X50_08980 [Gammaproteobacteria bacterium]|nr:hypothetical protein [Gammaproteobacteria bacterium]